MRRPKFALSDGLMLIVKTCAWISFNFWLPIGVILIAGLVSAHVQFKKRRENHEMLMSYVDYEEDEPININNIRPQPLDCRGWGAKDEEIEKVENFVAPTKFVKISGMIGVCPGLSMPDNIARMNQELKNKLAPGKTYGPYPWSKVTMDTGVGLVYVKFKTIEDATNAFNILDGISFDVNSSPPLVLPQGVHQSFYVLCVTLLSSQPTSNIIITSSPFSICLIP
uniref:Uncharacterized protein n=1 Tax=Caenorhabditis japonica TaxID=281687 RepID=A0A8R1IBV5_CAEJA